MQFMVMHAKTSPASVMSADVKWQIDNCRCMLHIGIYSSGWITYNMGFKHFRSLNTSFGLRIVACGQKHGT